MSGESLLVILVIGAVAGWLSGQIVRGYGFGLVANVCIGIIGALISSWAFPKLGIHMGSGIAASIVSATVGAVALLIVLGIFRRQRIW